MGREGLPARDRAADRRRVVRPEHHREVNGDRESGITDGIACIYSPHTTCCVPVNEFETAFIEDLSEVLQRLAGQVVAY